MKPISRSDRSKKMNLLWPRMAHAEETSQLELNTIRLSQQEYVDLRGFATVLTVIAPDQAKLKVDLTKKYGEYCLSVKMITNGNVFVAEGRGKSFYKLMYQVRRKLEDELINNTEFQRQPEMPPRLT